MPISARCVRTPNKYGIIDLEIAKFTPRASSTAGDARSRESGHRSLMPNGTTRHQ
jgi:hypothetical protein